MQHCARLQSTVYKVPQCQYRWHPKWQTGKTHGYKQNLAGLGKVEQKSPTEA